MVYVQRSKDNLWELFCLFTMRDLLWGLDSGHESWQQAPFPTEGTSLAHKQSILLLPLTHEQTATPETLCIPRKGTVELRDRLANHFPVVPVFSIAILEQFEKKCFKGLFLLFQKRPHGHDSEPRHPHFQSFLLEFPTAAFSDPKLWTVNPNVSLF